LRAAGTRSTSNKPAALRQSEANYRNLLQTANSVIIRYDRKDEFHQRLWVKLLGYEEHEI